MAGEKYSDADAGKVLSDLGALQDAGYDTSDAGRGNKAMSEADVAKDTDTSSSKAADAGHDARDAMAEAGDMGIPADRHGDES